MMKNLLITLLLLCPAQAFAGLGVCVWPDCEVRGDGTPIFDTFGLLPGTSTRNGEGWLPNPGATQKYYSTVDGITRRIGPVWAGVDATADVDSILAREGDSFADELSGPLANMAAFTFEPEIEAFGFSQDAGISTPGAKVNHDRERYSWTWTDGDANGTCLKQSASVTPMFPVNSSISFWLYREGEIEVRNIFALDLDGAGNNNDFQIAMSGAGDLTIKSGVGNTFLTTIDVITDDGWVAITIHFLANTIDVYKNGVLHETITAVGYTGWDQGKVIIGCAAGGTLLLANGAGTDKQWRLHEIVYDADTTAPAAFVAADVASKYLCGVDGTRDPAMVEAAQPVGGVTGPTTGDYACDTRSVTATEATLPTTYGFKMYGDSYVEGLESMFANIAVIGITDLGMTSFDYSISGGRLDAVVPGTGPYIASLTEWSTVCTVHYGFNDATGNRTADQFETSVNQMITGLLDTDKRCRHIFFDSMVKEVYDPTGEADTLCLGTEAKRTIYLEYQTDLLATIAADTTGRVHLGADWWNAEFTSDEFNFSGCHPNYRGSVRMTQDLVDRVKVVLESESGNW